MKLHQPMKKSNIILLLFILLLNACITKEQNSTHSLKETAKENLYLGQDPPGLIAEEFAPNIVTTEYMEFFGSFTPDLKEFYFKRKGGNYKNSTLVVFQNINNKWIESEVVPQEASVGEPSVSPDGNIIYLDHRYIERTKSGWSEVKSLGSPFNDMGIMRLTASSHGTYVFDEREEIGTLRYSRLINGKHEVPKVFGTDINSGKWTAHPFIAPDESYLIWDSERVGGFGETDLYISFRQENDTWGPAINMGAGINTKHNETFGSVTPDGKYLFFHTYLGKGKANIFWVDAKVIENLRAHQIIN